jgi:hypothetical protein
MPSRRMPQTVRPKPNRYMVWSIAAALSLALGYGGYAALAAAPWTCTSVIAALVAWGLASARNARRQIQSLAAQRMDESICTFARSFDTRAVDTWVIRAVYEQLQAELRSLAPRFPVRASDDLLRQLLLDPDDLDLSLAPDIAQRTGRSLDDTRRNPYFGKVHTARDLVLFFDAQPRVPTI